MSTVFSLHCTQVPSFKSIENKIFFSSHLLFVSRREMKFLLSVTVAFFTTYIVHVAYASASVLNNSVLHGASNQGNISFVQNFNSPSEMKSGHKSDAKGSDRDLKASLDGSASTVYQGTSNTFNWGHNTTIHNSINNYLQNDQTGASSHSQRVVPNNANQAHLNDNASLGSHVRGKKKSLNEKLESNSGEIN